MDLVRVFLLRLHLACFTVVLLYGISNHIGYLRMSPLFHCMPLFLLSYARDTSGCPPFLPLVLLLRGRIALQVANVGRPGNVTQISARPSTCEARSKGYIPLRLCSSNKGWHGQCYICATTGFRLSSVMAFLPGVPLEALKARYECPKGWGEKDSRGHCCDVVSL
jgi:hypothetical protein